MPKLGSFTYPAIELSDAVSIAQKIAREFRGEISVGGLAKALKMSEKGGGFIDKVAAVRDYGLIEGRGVLRITGLAQRIVFPNSSNEADEARGRAFLNIDLFEKLLERTGGTVPEEESFSIFLQEVTGASRMEVAKRVTALRRLFADGAQYGRTALEGGTPAVETRAITAGPPEVRRPSSAANVIELISGDIEIRLPRTKESVDIIIGVLNMIKNQIRGDGDGASEPG